MISPIKQRIACSETYRLFKSEGLRKAALHLWILLRDHWRFLLFIKVEGYIAEADLGDFKYSERYGQNIQAQGMEFHLLEPGEILPDFCYGITTQEINHRMAAGHRCYVLKQEGHVICADWVGFGRINYGGNSVYLYSDHTTFTLRPDQAWLYDSICDPRWRRKGFATALNNETLRHLKNTGSTSVLATVGVDNIGNIKAMLRSGFRIKEKVLFRRRLLFQIRKKQSLSEVDNTQLRLRYRV
jgi:RimJ/RimL family protein N-acetyltransferase